MRMAWNASNLLRAITMARSLLETGAIVRNLTDSVQKAVAAKDVEALDQAVMHAGFDTRDAVLLAERPDYKATNITTMIDRLDKSLFKDKTPRFRRSYGFLSEFVHPNYFGILDCTAKRLRGGIVSSLVIPLNTKKRFCPTLASRLR